MTPVRRGDPFSLVKEFSGVSIQTQDREGEGLLYGNPSSRPDRLGVKGGDISPVSLLSVLPTPVLTLVSRVVPHSGRGQTTINSNSNRNLLLSYWTRCLGTGMDVGPGIPVREHPCLSSDEETRKRLF